MKDYLKFKEKIDYTFQKYNEKVAIEYLLENGEKKEFIMPNTDKTAVEIEWALETPVREDIYEYIVNG